MAAGRAFVRATLRHVPATVLELAPSDHARFAARVATFVDAATRFEVEIAPGGPAPGSEGFLRAQEILRANLTAVQEAWRGLASFRPLRLAADRDPEVGEILGAFHSLRALLRAASRTPADPGLAEEAFLLFRTASDLERRERRLATELESAATRQ